MNRKLRLALMGAALVVFAVLCWFFLLNPIRGDISKVEQDIEDQRAQISLAQTTLAQAESMRQEGQRNQGRLLELGKMVPPTEELPSLLLQLQDLADQSGIQFIAVTPGELKAPDSGSDYMVLPLELQFTGTYFDVSDFAWRAEQMVAGPGRLLAIKTLGIELDTTDTAAGVSPQLSVNISLYAFIMAEQPKASAPSAPSDTSSDGSSAQ